MDLLLIRTNMETAGGLHLAVVLTALHACALKSTLDAAVVHMLDLPLS